MKKFIGDHLAILSIIVFLLLIGSMKAYRNSTYKASLPIRFSKEFSPEEQKIIRANIYACLKYWQEDFARNSKWVTIKIIRDFPSKDDYHLIGRYHGGLELITLEAGKYNEVPALYHELCHLNLDVTGEHKEKGWKQWNLRCREISIMFAKKKYQVDPTLVPSIIPYYTEEELFALK